MERVLSTLLPWPPLVLSPLCLSREHQQKIGTQLPIVLQLKQRQTHPTPHVQCALLTVRTIQIELLERPWFANYHSGILVNHMTRHMTNSDWLSDCKTAQSHGIGVKQHGIRTSRKMVS